MKTILITVAILGAMSLSAQSIERQVIGTTGGTATVGTLIVTSTTGEAIINTFIGGTITLTQGYQQATDSLAVSIKEIQVEANYKLYPNPTVNGAKLDITTLNLNANAIVSLYTSRGKLISNQKVNLQSGVKTSIIFNLNDKEAGIYFIKIFDNKSKLAKTLRLIKK